MTNPRDVMAPGSLGERLQDEGFAKEWALRIEAIALAWLKERMPTREEIVNEWAASGHDWDEAKPEDRKRLSRSLAQADALLDLLTRTVAG